MHIQIYFIFQVSTQWVKLREDLTLRFLCLSEEKSQMHFKLYQKEEKYDLKKKE